MKDDAVDSFISTAKTVFSDLKEPTSGGGSYGESRTVDYDAARLVKLSDAMIALDLFYAYSLRRSFAAEWAARQRAIESALRDFVVTMSARKLARVVLVRLVSLVGGILLSLLRLIDRAETQATIARRIRHHSWASRADLAEASLKSDNPRSTKKVAKRV